MNTLFLNATTAESMTVIAQLDEQGYRPRVANSFQKAIMALEEEVPDLIVIDATLEFGSTDALMYIRNMFSGNIVAYGLNISPATRQFLSHLGVSTILRSVSDVTALIAEESPVPNLAAA